MTIGDAFTWLLLGALLVLFIQQVYLARRSDLAVRLRQHLQATPPALPILGTIPAPEPAAGDASRRWHAMPGNRLELADTGFYIVLDLSPTQPLYALYSPEHYRMGYGCDLVGLKAYGARLAAERHEFADVPALDLRRLPGAR
jgi:hypothetical protein